MVLTNKQRVFVTEYLVDMNATQAAIRAGYSKRSAARIAVELLNKNHVAQAVQEAQNARAAQSQRTAQDVLRDIQEVTRDARQSGQFKIALRGLELEGKHLGMFTERVEMSGALNLSAIIEEARSRVRSRS